jgi:hypothetical protein
VSKVANCGKSSYCVAEGRFNVIFGGKWGQKRHDLAAATTQNNFFQGAALNLSTTTKYDTSGVQ